MPTSYRWAAIAVTALFILAIVVTCVQAIAHEAPMGWAYSNQCCSGRDCAMETEEVKATPQGWFVSSTGETVPYNDDRIRESLDGSFHRCQLQHATLLRCLYVPPSSY